jgi:hypothetical protein
VDVDAQPCSGLVPPAPSTNFHDGRATCGQELMAGERRSGLPHSVSWPGNLMRSERHQRRSPWGCPGLRTTAPTLCREIQNEADNTGCGDPAKPRCI